MSEQSTNLGEYKYSYDATGSVTGIVDPLGYVTSFAYDSGGRLVTHIDRRGYVTSFAYDPTTGNLTGSTDPSGRSVSSVFDAVGNVLRVQDSRGNATDYEFDNLRRTTRVTLPLDQHQRRLSVGYQYDQRGRVTAVTKSDGTLSAYENDTWGRTTRLTDPCGAVSRQSFDAAGRLVQLVNPLGATFEVGYDSLDRMVSAGYAGQPAARRSKYDDVGNCIEATYADGRTIRRTFDECDRVIQETESSGFTWTFERAAGGAITAAYDSAGRRFEYSYDLLGRVLTVRSIDATASVVTRHAYDPDGRVIEATDELGLTTRYEYDVTGNLAAETDAAGASKSWVRDHAGNVESYTNANGHTWSYVRDAIGRMIAERDPLGNAATFEYDLAGSLVAHVDSDGQRAEYVYDNMRRLQRIGLADGAWVQFGYDASGRRVSINAASGAVVNYTYDALGRLSESNWPSLGRSVQYSYTPAGQRSGLVVKNLATGTAEQVVSYEWDTFGRLARALPWSGGAAEFTYNPEGTPALVTLPTGLSKQMSYDGHGHLSSIVYRTAGAQEIARYSCTRDAAGNPIVTRDSEGESRYTFDRAKRLQEVTYPDGTWERFAYDAAGNRVRKDSQDGTVEYDYDSSERLLAERGARNVAYEWSRSSRLLARTEAAGTTRFGWSLDGKLQQVVQPDGRSVAFEYAPGLGCRTMIRDASGQERRFLWDSSNMLQELDVQNSTLQDYVQEPCGNTNLCTVQGGRALDFISDLVGNVRGLSDGLGQPACEYSYAAFGTPRRVQETVPSPWRFAGLQDSGGSGLLFAQARYYEPQLGVFLSIDPAFRSFSEPPYVYARSNPVAYHDPGGRSSTLFEWDVTRAELGKTTTGLMAIAEYGGQRPVRGYPDDYLGQVQTYWNKSTVQAALMLSRDARTGERRTYEEPRDLFYVGTLNLLLLQTLSDQRAALTFVHEGNHVAKAMTRAAETACNDYVTVSIDKQFDEEADGVKRQVEFFRERWPDAGTAPSEGVENHTAFDFGKNVVAPYLAGKDPWLNGYVRRTWGQFIRGDFRQRKEFTAPFFSIATPYWLDPAF